MIQCNSETLYHFGVRFEVFPDLQVYLFSTVSYLYPESGTFQPTDVSFWESLTLVEGCNWLQLPDRGTVYPSIFVGTRT